MQFNSRFSFVYKLLREIKGLSYLYKNIVDNFPMEKYQKLVEALKEVMTHPNMKGAVIKYLEETNK